MRPDGSHRAPRRRLSGHGSLDSTGALELAKAQGLREVFISARDEPASREMAEGADSENDNDSGDESTPHGETGSGAGQEQQNPQDEAAPQGTA